MATASDDPAGGGVHDRDLDLTPVRPGGRTRRRRGVLEGYQRLIANPFLALLGLVAWYGVVRQVVLAKRLDLFVPAVASLAVVGFLFQFHCLDCGKTGRLSRWRTHSCEAVRLRFETDAPRRLRAMTPVAQTLLWFYLLVIGLVVGFIMTR